MVLTVFSELWSRAPPPHAGAAGVHALERTSVAAWAHELAAANGVAETVKVIHGDVMDI